MKFTINESGENQSVLMNKGGDLTANEMLLEFFDQTPLDIDFSEQNVPDSKFLIPDNRKPLIEKKGKYLDPITGAYYTTIEEFKKIRTLKDIRDLEKHSVEAEILKKLLLSKKKKYGLIKISSF